jgi:mRNA-degrading endonuclease RelE of RelBE toxin-antitoxin system
MNYSILWKPGPLKFLKKLDKQDCIRILKKVDLLIEEPFRFLEHFEGDFYKLRIGDYRALIDLDLKEKIIIIQVLDKRGRIYK